MMPLPAALSGGGSLTAWRLDRRSFAAEWDSGEGAQLYGGRWNTPGKRVVYASLDPATTILEVAVHAGFAMLQQVPHVTTRFSIDDASDIHVVTPANLPVKTWLSAGHAAANQQAFGDQLLAAHRFVLLPSTVSPLSWNCLFNPDRAKKHYRWLEQILFVFDARLKK